MKDTAFLVSQPLQVLVALSIIEQLNISKASRILFVGKFFNAKEIYERMRGADWQFSDLAIDFFNDHKEAYKFARQQDITNFFTEGDVGVKNFLYLLSLKLRLHPVTINIYEEGLGTYRTDLYSGLKKTILNFFGVGTNFGGCSLTNTLYVFNPDEYLKAFPGYKKALKKIEKTLVDVIRTHFDSLGYIFDRSPIAEKFGEMCNVYLTDHIIDFDFLENFSLLPGDKYIKPHPRAYATTEKWHGTLLSRTAPAEMALLDLKQFYKIVNVYHHGSSVARYFKADNVNFLKI